MERREIVRLETLCKRVRDYTLHTPLDMYINLKLVASEFTDFDRLHAFLGWVLLRIGQSSQMKPHSLELCVNSYHLKEELTDYERKPFLNALHQIVSRLIASGGCERLSDLRVYMFKQSALELNDGLCVIIHPLL